MTETPYWPASPTASLHLLGRALFETPEGYFVVSNPHPKYVGEVQSCDEPSTPGGCERCAAMIAEGLEHRP